MKRDLNNPQYYWIVETYVYDPNWETIIEYLNSKYNTGYSGNIANYYGHATINTANAADEINHFPNNPELLTIDQFIELLNNKDMKFPVELKSGMIAKLNDGKCALITVINNIALSTSESGWDRIESSFFTRTDNHCIASINDAVVQSPNDNGHLLIPNKWDKAFIEFPENTIWTRDTIKLTGEYTAKINKTDKVVEVGCQRISFEKVEELYKAIKN